MNSSLELDHAYDLNIKLDDKAHIKVEHSVYYGQPDGGIDTFGTFGSAGTFGGCFGCMGTAGCCC